MNSLGLAYGSSSDDDDDDERDKQQQQTRSEAPSTVVASATEATTTATPSARNEDDELEAMLARAGVPPEPVGVSADAAVQERIRKYIAAQQEQHGGARTESGESSFQASLRAKKDVRNPYILHKVVAHFGIDELQTNFDPRVFDPHALPLHEFSDALALAQKKRSDAREQMQLQHHARQLQFTHGAG